MHDPLGDFRDEALALLEEAFHSLALSVSELRLSRAPEGKGDFAFPCFQPAAANSRRPEELARSVQDALAPSKHFEARAAGPYVNFLLRDAPLADAVTKSIHHHGKMFGSQPKGGPGVILEHTSANPTGPLHVGRGRNPIIGDSLARVLRAAGHEVVTEYYVNDLGKQICILAWGVRRIRDDPANNARYRHAMDLVRQSLEQKDGLREKPDHRLVLYYQAANIEMENNTEARAEIDAMAARAETDPRFAAEDLQPVAKEALDGIRESLARLRVGFDRFTWESEVVASGSVEHVIEALRASGHAAQEDGAWYLDLAPFGIHGKDTRFFFTRRDGSSLYPTRDIAYHLDKLARSGRAGRVVNVLGEDHKLEARQLSAALRLIRGPRARLLGPGPGVAVEHDGGDVRTIEPIFYSFVSLPEGRMSTRRGRVVSLDDLMDEAEDRALEEVRKRRPELSGPEMLAIARVVGIGAVRFNIAGVQAEKQIVFHWEEALDFEGASAPFVQYAHARASSILRKGAEQGLKPSWEARVTHPSEARLLRSLARLPGLVRECAAELKVHPLAPYAVEVAGVFNEFYRDCPVLIAEEGLRGSRLSLVAMSKTVLANTLDLLGIEAPESM